MTITVKDMVIKKKLSGSYVIDVLLKDETEYRTVGAAKTSPVGQCIRLLERLLLLSDRLGGYNRGRTN